MQLKPRAPIVLAVIAGLLASLTIRRLRARRRDAAGTKQPLQSVFNEIESRNRELEDLVRKRTAELMVAKERAEVADKRKSAFLASMNHELRTPLNAILGYTQALRRDTNLNERQVASLKTMQQSGEHLLTLINDMLDLSRIDAGKFELYNGTVDLPTVLQLITDIIRVKAEQKGLMFTCEPAPDLPRTVLMDERRLRQVLLNLLSNAVKFTDHGQVRMQVRSMPCDAGHAKLRFEVHDTGVGMRQEELETIFHGFAQVGDVQRRVAGSGLGLSISRQLVRLMNSDIHVESRSGEGSTFSFELTVPTAEAAAAQPAPLSAASDIIGYQDEPKTVLILDEVAANRAMLANLLDSLGFETMEARDAPGSTQQADLVLMSVSGGMDALPRLRRIKESHTAPVIAISARQEDNTESIAAGAAAFITRPIDTTLLLQKIGEALDLNWILAAPRTPGMPAHQHESVLIAPPSDEMDALYELARSGNMRDIRQYARHLAKLDTRYRPFADKLQRLAETYQSKAIVNLVEKYRNRDES